MNNSKIQKKNYKYDPKDKEKKDIKKIRMEYRCSHDINTVLLDHYMSFDRASIRRLKAALGQASKETAKASKRAQNPRKKSKKWWKWFHHIWKTIISMIENLEFNAEMEELKKLPLLEKKIETIKRDVETMNLLAEMNKNFGVSKNITISKEINDIKIDNISEDGFVEAMYAYIFMISEGYAEILNVKLDEVGYE